MRIPQLTSMPKTKHGTRRKFNENVEEMQHASLLSWWQWHRNNEQTERDWWPNRGLHGRKPMAYFNVAHCQDASNTHSGACKWKTADYQLCHSTMCTVGAGGTFCIEVISEYMTSLGMHTGLTTYACFINWNALVWQKQELRQQNIIHQRVLQIEEDPRGKGPWVVAIITYISDI